MRVTWGRKDGKTCHQSHRVFFSLHSLLSFFSFSYVYSPFRVSPVRVSLLLRLLHRLWSRRRRIRFVEKLALPGGFLIPPKNSGLSFILYISISLCQREKTLFSYITCHTQFLFVAFFFFSLRLLPPLLSPLIRSLDGTRKDAGRYRRVFCIYVYIHIYLF